jgi:hypothetical protein
MAVPRKRKKLDKTADALKRKPARKPLAKPAARAEAEPASASDKKSDKKIDDAFQIMDHIEDDGNSASQGSGNRRPQAKNGRKATRKPRKLGFRFRFSVDAVMPEPGSSKDDTPASKDIDRSSLVDVGLTIPFIWKVPIIGGIAQKLARSLKTIKI